jgi:hypothetical protein
MIRDQCILVRADGRVMFDSPAPQARKPVESRDAWLARTVGKAQAEQGKRGIALTQHERIAPEERPPSKVRDAVRIDPLTGRLTMPLEAAREVLRERYVREAAAQLDRLKIMGQAARWFSPVADPAVVVWEKRLAALEAEARRIADDLRQARSVEDLLAIEPHWISGD